jgi:putative ATP-binding cassette transporter
MLSLFLYLYRVSKLELIGSLGASLASAGLNVLLMAYIIRVFKTESHLGRYLLYFALVSVMLLVSRTASELCLIHVTQHNVCRLQLRISEQVAAMQQALLERLGSTSIFSVLFDDVTLVSRIGSLLPVLVMNLCILIGVLLYLFHVSILAFALLSVMIGASILGYRLLAKDAFRIMSVCRREQDKLLAMMGDLVKGSKELRLNTRKHMLLLAEIEASANQSRQAAIQAWHKYAPAAGWVQTSYFAAIGLLLVSRQWSLFGMNQQVTLTAVFTILLMKGALESIVGVLPVLGRAEVAIVHIEALGMEFRKHDNSSFISPNPDIKMPRRFDRIRLLGVTYEYDDSAIRTGFTLGPVSLDFCRGEILFIAGGNGSGKTSLLKLIAGLYSPSAGTVELDGTPIDETSVRRYRQLFSAVFQDFQIFKKFDHPTQECLIRARKYLAEFRLENVVTIDDIGFRAGTLSRGQRKRLALIVSLLEDKPIYILDEWAADQDQDFRAHFYNVILSRLRSEGRTAIVVTHDDTWLHSADRLLWLNNGELTATPTTKLASVALS